MMEKTNNPSEDIPAFLSGTLDEEGTARLRKALAESAELRDELEFWKKMRAVVRIDAAREAAGHLSPSVILEYIEGTLRQTAETETHLRSCDECQEIVESLRLTYSHREEKHSLRTPSALEALLVYFTMPRVSYALGILAVAIVIASGIAYFLGGRTPEWRQLQAQGDLKVEQGSRDAAKILYERALESASPVEPAEAGEISAILDSLASIHRLNGEHAEARTLLEQSLAAKESGGLGGTWSYAWVLEQLGSLDRLAGNDLSAESQFREADAIREELAKANPGDQSLQRYRRNVALIRLVPQIGFRGPETPHFPTVDFDSETTHAEFLIVLRKNRALTGSYVPSLTTPGRRVLQIPDTLLVDPLHPSERTLRLTLSKRFFEEGKGTYRVGIRKLAESESIEDFYYFQVD